jgi:hypothetical protein
VELRVNIVILSYDGASCAVPITHSADSHTVIFLSSFFKDTDSC